ncbi:MULTISPECIES: efflux transporter outer membrane subunit [Pseudomonas]|uniref:Outer membrane protein OprM n=1 Tax=Pseudomonas fluorescens TaxID=294 RepID=A0A5E6PI62_PSEFL|nr:MULTISPECIES: efflux transporter outer membrane subunit [Pseudomonas]VVM42366.1 Outer membrane protein OprM [Pseudomonas fluorescens]
MKPITFAYSLLTLAVLLGGCSLGKPAESIEVEAPANYREIAAENADRWKLAEPADGKDRGHWWRVFADPKLEQLILQAEQASPTLTVAFARVQEARAQAGMAKADGALQLGVGAGPTRQATARSSQTRLRANLNASYEVDLFGALKDNSRAAALEAMGEEAAYRSVLLALQADVARSYFSLGALDSEIAVLTETIGLRQEALQMVQRQFDAGDRSELETAQARTELASAQASLEAVTRQRASQDHALAVLVGKPPAAFSLTVGGLRSSRMQVPAGLPSELLERRPDIAQAQRRMAAASARIGVAKAAFFPRLVLTASGGFESSDLNDLFKWSSRSWVLGPLLGTVMNMPLLDGGRNQSGLDKANAQYDGAVAAYRQQVLVAFKDVEDSLSDIRTLDRELAFQDEAVNAAGRAAALADTRYRNGSTSYFESIDAQRSSLDAQRAQVQVAGERSRAYVRLITALGGGWVDTPGAAQAQLAKVTEH